MSWRQRAKPQPPGTKFKIPPIDAPNVARRAGPRLPRHRDADRRSGARPPSGSTSSPGKVAALYVFDPGPAGSIGDLAWVIAARKSGALKTLIVHGVLMTDLAEAADIVLPGPRGSRRMRRT